MKKANFTLFQPQRWMSKIGQSALAVLFVLCCMGLQTADAQEVTGTIVHPQDIDDDGQQDTTGVYKIEVCDGANILYTDDNTDHGNYYDNHRADFTDFSGISRDTFEICPQDQWHTVEVNFTEFNLATGDALNVFQGDIEELDAAGVAAAAAADAAAAAAYAAVLAADPAAIAAAAAAATAEADAAIAAADAAAAAEADAAAAAAAATLAAADAAVITTAQAAVDAAALVTTTAADVVAADAAVITAADAVHVAEQAVINNTGTAADVVAAAAALAEAETAADVAAAAAALAVNASISADAIAAAAVTAAADAATADAAAAATAMAATATATASTATATASAAAAEIAAAAVPAACVEAATAALATAEMAYAEAQADSTDAINLVATTAAALVTAMEAKEVTAANLAAAIIAAADAAADAAAADAAVITAQQAVDDAKLLGEDDATIEALTALVVEAAETAEAYTEAMLLAAEDVVAATEADNNAAADVVAAQTAAAAAPADILLINGLTLNARLAYLAAVEDLATKTAANNALIAAAEAAAEAAAAAAPGASINRLTGQSVGSIGGTVAADCNPAINPTGCLTFIFERNGDNLKGKGWEAWVTCDLRDTEIQNDAIADVNLECFEVLPFFVPGTVIPHPDVFTCGAVLTAGNDFTRIIITNQQGDTCINQVGSSIAGDEVNFFPEPGIYNVEYTLLSDTEKQENDRFAVQLPSLVCNDNLNIPFGSSACAVQILPDFLLEDPCNGGFDFSPFLSYDITVYLGDTEIGTTITFDGNADDLGDVWNTGNYTIEYPSIDKDDLAAAGIDVCGNNIRVRIERINNYWTEIYTGDNNFGPCTPRSISTSCESYFNIYDQTAPRFTSSTGEPDTLIACDAAGIAELVSNPDVVDNCGSYTIDVTYTGLEMLDDVCFDTARIQIVYTATDACMNQSAPVTQDVVIIRPGPEYVTSVASDTLECNSTEDSALKPGLAIGKLTDGEFEPTDTIELFEDRYECGYILDSRDVTLPAPGCGEKVFRYWSVLDWCDPVAPSPVDTQFILYTDREAPVFAESDNSEENPQIIELGPFDCSTTEIPDAPTADDACAGDVSDNVRMIAIEQLVDSEWIAYTEDAYTCDTFRIEYAVGDDCQTQLLEDSTYTYFIVEDVTPPSAICTDELIVSVGSGAVRLTADDLNAGSYDACEELTFKVRIEGTTEWEDYVDLTCEHKPSVNLELQVTGDKSDPVTCWSKITVEDKIAPVCDQLDNETRNCTDFHPDQYGETGVLVAGSDLEEFYNDNFGKPFDGCSDNCGVTVYNQSITVNRGDCGEIDIVRTYSVQDWGGLSSPTYTQTITVEQVHDFKLTFPADDEVECSDEDKSSLTAWNLDQILTENNGCDIFALEVSEREFTVDGDFCKRVERTYEVINWCTYVAGTDAQPVDHVAEGGAMMTDELATSGRFVYTQIIRYSVDSAPTIALDDVKQEITEFDVVAPYESTCIAERTFSAAALNCLDIEITNFTHILKVTDPSGVERTVTTDENGVGNSFTYAVEPGYKYAVEFWAFDECGNSVGIDSVYTFVDAVRPTPFVLHGLAVELMQNTTVEVWASDLDRGSFDNCSDDKNLELRIALGLPEDGPGADADADAVRAATGTNIEFSCDNYTNQAVSFYVIDEAGNWDVVETYILVQDNFNVCGDGVEPMGSIAGKITNAFGENVEAVSVSVNGGDNTMTTTSTGQFAFNLPLEGDYTITPEKNMNPLNGVSTFDLVLISKHILGLQSFDSPYKYIAADVNKSGSITAFDMVQLRQLILNVTSEFPNNTSWRFVDAKHEFTSANPAAENFDEFMSINNLAGEMLDVNFIAAKIGDVNGTASANSLLGAESRNVNGTLNLNVTDRLVEAGQTVTVDFTSADIATAQGYQFTMDFAGLELVELNEGVAKAANFNTNVANRGMLTTSWNGEATANDVLFSLTFTATTNGLLSELVSVNSDLTVAEAYNNAGELMNVALDFSTSATTAAFDLQQNTPNPFNGETVIGFNLPEAGLATLKVMDIQGKVLTSIERDGVKGYNQVTINARSLSATGVLYYQLESADNVATKKMIIID